MYSSVITFMGVETRFPGLMLLFSPSYSVITSNYGKASVGSYFLGKAGASAAGSSSLGRAGLNAFLGGEISPMIGPDKSNTNALVSLRYLL